MGLRFTVHDSGLSAIGDILQKKSTKAENALAIAVQKDTEPFVPALTKTLANSTKVKGGKIIYPGPYARYLYHGKVMVNAATGKGPAHFIDKNGNEAFRFPKGSRLKATDRNLVFTKEVHPNAQDHWFEASKAQNLNKWERIAAKEVSK